MSASETSDLSDNVEDVRKPGFFSFRRRWFRITFAIIVILCAIIIVLYSQREALVRDFVSAELERQGIEATYDIEQLDFRKQALTNIKLGNADSPDATIRRMELSLRAIWGGVKVEQIKIDGLRMFGTYKNNKLSLGSLDKFLESDSDEPPELPDFQIIMTDARARLDTDYGVVGISADGRGNLRHDFKGNVAAISDRLAYDGCAIARPSLFGNLKLQNGNPVFTGPIRMRSLACPGQELTLGQTDIQASIATRDDFETVTAKAGVDLQKLRYAAIFANSARLNTDVNWNAAGLSGDTDIRASAVSMNDIRSGTIELNGNFSAFNDFSKAGFDGAIGARNVQIPQSQWAELEKFAQVTRETPVEQLLKKFMAAARPQAGRMRLNAPLTVNYAPERTNIYISNAQAYNSYGGQLANARNLKVGLDSNGLRNAAGSLAITGAGLPKLSLDFDALSVNSFRLTARMPAYSSGASSLALPLLILKKNGAGGYGFSGEAVMSGPLPDGYVDNLQIPVFGSWSDRAGLRMYDRCQTLRFDALKYATIRIAAKSLRLCPQSGGTIVSQRGGSMVVSASVPDSKIDGFLGDTPIAFDARQLSFSLPGDVTARDLNIAIGSGETVTKIQAREFNGTLAQNITGTFSGASAGISNVPLDLTEGEGQLQFVDSVLSLSADNWIVSDRDKLARFEPLVTRNARIKLENSIITASGLLREPDTDVAVMGVDIAHDLNRSSGGADLNVAGIMFDDNLQPEMLTGLALGVVANVQGSVRGNGRIDWNNEGVKSTGAFTTDDMDLAAAFGPVTGLSGTINFSDLLGLETFPGQTVSLTEVNPGIAVEGGVVKYQLLPDFRMKIEGGHWDFAGGDLYLEPTILDFSEEKVRNLVFRVENLDAAKFLLRFDFDSLAATGIFDGRLPMVFDQDGGRIEDGRLDVRSEGGTLAYVGELTYEDLSPMGNYAFNALRSLRYKELTIQMEGPLDGEIVTDVTMTGITQGEGAQKNFITKELAKLPLEFNIKITAPFMQLIGTARSLYDAEYLLNPIDAGLVRPPGPAPQPEKGAQTPQNGELKQEDDTNDNNSVQTLESENMP